MGDNKAFASLSSGLLARKGQARPAMRPQGYGLGQGNPDDLGWNDMGYDVPRSFGAQLPANLAGGPSAVLPDLAEVPQVVQQQHEIAREFAPVEQAAAAPELPVEAVEAVEPTPIVSKVVKAPARPAKLAQPVKTAARTAGRKAAFTLRLDAERHLRLRLACAVQNRSAQMLVTEALDRLLSDLPDVERLATSLPGTD